MTAGGEGCRVAADGFVRAAEMLAQASEASNLPAASPYNWAGWIQVGRVAGRQQMGLEEQQDAVLRHLRRLAPELLSQPIGC
ncbi:hypothetical protein ABBQ32_011689 [Trebouxia sp. C0010 RCD-2024]